MSRIRGMRGYLSSSIGVVCATALALPLTLPATPASASARPAETRPATEAPAVPVAAAAPAVPGSTQSLPLAPRPGDRTLGPAAEQGLYRPDVRHFSLVGVIWDNPDTELYGKVQVRTREAAGGHWSGWQDVETHNHEHSADPDTAERVSGRVRGSTAPLWVGDSDGVEVRVRADGEGRASETRSPLPAGMRLELVDPGTAPADPAGQPARTTEPTGQTGQPGQEGQEGQTGSRGTTETEYATASARSAAESAAANADLAPLGATEIPALDRRRTEEEALTLRGQEARPEERQVTPYIGPRPRIVTRRGWGADEGLRESGFVYTKTVKAAFVHHTASGNKYWCSEVPSLIRSIYRYHVESSGWRDIGYNFLVDRCGNIYEGRAGGVAKPVMGAHTLGFNTNSMGIAVLGTFVDSKPSKRAVGAIARLTAWKLGLFGGNPNGKTYLTSGGGNLYPKGKNVRLNVISGHRDGFATECPGRLLYGRLGSARKSAAAYQGR
ncbi:peptidoglycan recognition protein [Streptomyces sp. WI04-05B]|uniref:peptidoglycan recognition protein family protein n=1 Tax=Streptomyces TaxID=1883 RepID=UPI0029B80196|nr:MULTISPECIES: peptidoglycan recognition protein [unclassified Streptomyces]MDX2544284.1 peptidoglycan recognition protein [Streptomyces sp. WI04-05B]MDX2588647.1 peptidoglycan recognition protein [Streptomyces sp. WI04-05A]